MPNLSGYVKEALKAVTQLEMALDRLWQYRETMDATAPDAICDPDFEGLQSLVEDVASHEALA